ncbi:hypothetical protein F5Y19DRAFT_51216 [Xylariaceae sp. FL1651]|nr:hypothetical protein F5Y19DRAFT_51216 [Xylariaceae sp. FL1651]
MSSTAGPKAPSPTKVIGTRQPDVSYVTRHAVRVVAVNAAGRIALLHARKGNYYKLPGGGVEAAAAADDGEEDHGSAAAREVREETGAVVAVRKPAACFASTEEFRNGLHQISYAYIADVIDDDDGASGGPELTEEEIVDGLAHEWVPARQALDKMSAVEPTSDLGRFIKERDVYLLGEAIRKLQL